MDQEKSRFKIITLDNGVEILFERHVHEDTKDPAILISFFAENEDVSVKITMSESYKPTEDGGDETRDNNWREMDLIALANNYYDSGMKMFNDMMSK